MSGNFSKNATIYTNDPKHPRMTVSIAGRILHYVDVTPSSRVFLRGMYGEKVVKELTIRSSEKKKDFKILKLSSNIDDKITYKAVPNPEPGVYTVQIFKNPKLPTMNTWGSVTILTNSEKAPSKKIQINVTTRGSIVVQPAVLNFGSVSAEVSRFQFHEASYTNYPELCRRFKVRGRPADLYSLVHGRGESIYATPSAWRKAKDYKRVRKPPASG